MSDEVQVETGWRWDEDNSTWRPPRALGSHRHTLADLDPGTWPPNVLVPAGQVVAGIFRTGSFTINGDLTIASGSLRMQGSGDSPKRRIFSWDGLELAHPASTPYIDFHRSSDPTEATDYNMRLINETAGYLTCYGGIFKINSSVADNLWVTGSLANLRLDGRDGGAFSALYTNGGYFRVWNSGGGVDVIGVGPILNGTEWGLKSFYNLQGTEVYASGWFRQMTAGNGWYHNVHGGGIYLNDGTWVRTYGSKYFYCDRYVRGEWGLVATNNPVYYRGEGDASTTSFTTSGGYSSPANGTQSLDGPSHRGWISNSFGSATNRFNNIIFRTWDNGGDYRIDSFAPHHHLQGTFTDGGTKSFLIDHPVLGEDYHLCYAAIEGPAVDLIFRGRITLKNGKATVNLDDEVGQEEGTFEALTFVEGRQFFLYNETGTANPQGKWIPNAGDLEVTCADKTATVGWMVLATRKAGLHADYGLTEDKHLLVEWKKDELEHGTTTDKHDFEEAANRELAELRKYRDALPGSEKNIDQKIASLQARQAEFVSQRTKFREVHHGKREFWKNQKVKAQARKKAKGR